MLRSETFQKTEQKEISCQTAAHEPHEGICAKDCTTDVLSSAR